MLTRLTVILLTSFLTLSCATKLYIPGNRFVTPEASGGLFKGDVKMGRVGVTHVQVADDVTSTTPDTTPVLVENTSLFFGGQLGLAESVDLYLSDTMGGASFAGAKLQIIGDPSTTAKQGNISFALAGGAGFGNLTDEVTSNSIEAKSTVEFGGWEAMALIGYRPTDGILTYMSPFMSKVTADVKIERTAAGVTLVTAEPNGYAEMKGFTSGVKFGQKIFLNIEASYTETVWTREQPSELKSDKFGDTAWGVAVGGSW